ncbi:ROK family protein [Bailinhaonella thermotolerans]|uniref:ROK family protein n=1 Tax=Bailinhaonella thermotolerans TaxID=1070861 RepID=A0A3A4ANE7_9ACTN|nr:ROK family protein [Bailinhaonella thermotolerans]RJL30069.1 ROK family protein [Bailinhaonella thermotolerans]
MTHALAIDIGGTKIAAALVDPGGAVSHRWTRPTPRTEDPEEVFRTVSRLAAHVLAGAGDTARGAAVGVGSAGPLDPRAGTVSPVNIPAWRAFPLVDRLAESLDRPVVLAGDGHCFALGEHAAGAGTGARALLGVVVSTGVGAGLVLDGMPRFGPSGNAGHLGHAIADPEGEPCACGSRGCVETCSSGPAMVRWARGRGWRPEEPEADAAVLAADARAGDPVALAAFDRAARALAAALLSAAAVVDLDRVVIGGGVARSADVLFGPLRAWFDRLAGLDFLRRVQLAPSTLIGDAGLVGAAALTRLPAPAGAAA